MSLRSSRFVRARRGLLCLGALAGATIPSGVVAQLGTSLPTKRFIFDAGVRASSGVTFSFTRDVSTVDPGGRAVPRHVPRFAPQTSLAAAPRFEQIRATSAPTSMIASGLDHDGVTPLLVTYEAGPGRSFLDVFIGAGDAVIAAEKSGIGRIRTIVNGSGDLMGGTIAGKRYRVTSGVVCHGLIVLFCTVSAFDAQAQAWRDSANAFIVSQNEGRSWSLGYESDPFFPGASRGAPWTMQNWWPTRRGMPPEEAFFAATDYCANPGSPGGRFYLMRAMRPAIGQPWALQPGAAAMTVAGNRGEHMHIGGVLPYGDNGIRAFLALGDSRRNNRIVSLVNRNGDYTTGQWEVLGAYHGAAGDPGVEGNQFVGCAPGPWEGSVLVGSDLSVEQIMLLTMDEESGHPRTQRLHGLPAVDMTGNNAFIIRTPTPELGGPYCANSEPFEFLTVPFTRRTLYSPDGVRWAQAAAPAGGYPVIHGPHIYFDGAPGQGIVRTAVPELVTGHPLLIGPGGLQHSRSDPVIDAGSPPRMTPLTRDSLGRWTDNGVPLDPQPPTLGPVYRIRTSVDDSSPWIARVRPAGAANALTTILGNQVQVRVWVYQADASRSATLSIGIGDTQHAPQLYRSCNVPSTDSWIPVTATENVDLAPGTTLQLYMRCVGETCNDQTLYLALDSVQEGAGMPGYPMPPDVSLPPAGTAFPDEQARLTGFSCGRAWTATLALQVPEDGFDFTCALQSRWPLATLWGDERNYIELFADTSEGRVVSRITVNGRAARTIQSNAGVFVRGTPILVSIAQPLGNAGTEMTVSVAGLGVSTTALPLVSTPGLVVPPREIRFGAVTAFPSSSGRGVAVSPLLIWGGRVDENRALSRTEREQLLRTLSFLREPLP